MPLLATYIVICVTSAYTFKLSPKHVYDHLLIKDSYVALC